MQRPAHNDLPFGDITGKIRHRVSLVIFRHCKHWNHRDRPVSAFQTTGTLIDRRKVRIQITGITATAWNLFSRGTDLTQSLAIVRHIVKYDKHLHTFFKRKILRCCKCHPRRCNSLDSRVIRKIDKHNSTLDSARICKVVNKELCRLESNTHRSKYHRKTLTFAPNRCLPCKLCRYLVMRQTSTGKDRKFLTPNKRVQTVDSRNTRLDKLVRKISCIRVDRITIDIHSLLSDHSRAAVLGLANTIKHPAEDIRRNPKLHRLTKKTNLGILGVYTFGTLEYLNHHLITINLKDLTVTH